MIDFTKTVIFGPAYLDTVVKINGKIIAELSAPLDQSLPVISIMPDDSRRVRIVSDIGDDVIIPLADYSACVSGEYRLREGILSRRCGDNCPPVKITLTADACFQQLGGMGAGYAKSLGGTLRMPLGDDSLGENLREMLANCGIVSSPAILPGHTSDSTLLIQSHTGDKLAAGYRDALLHWQPDEDDFKLAKMAENIIFCGGLNSFTGKILSADINVPVMCAPSMRNIDDTAFPLADFAAKIDYLTMNALEWSHLKRQDEIINNIPLITITDGARGCDIYLYGKEYFYPALPHPGPVDTNRAGETYAATIWKAVLAFCPAFPREKIPESLLARIANIAAKQAHRQLDITNFAFPDDDRITGDIPL